MWMGSTQSPFDEWIELKNMTSDEVDLSGWPITRIENTGAETLMLVLPVGASIPANGFYLISNYSDSSDSSALNVAPNYIDTSVSLSNLLLQIKIYDESSNLANLIDIAGDGGLPLTGAHGINKESMARKSNSNDGALISDWFSDSTHNSKTYWDDKEYNSEGNNFGTPGGPNV